MPAYLKQKIAVCKELGLVRIVLFPLAASLVLLLLLLSKIMKVRVHQVQNNRIGHFMAFTALPYLQASYDKERLGTRGINIYAMASLTSANIFLEKMWKRTVPLISGNLGWLINDLFKRIPKIT